MFDGNMTLCYHKVNFPVHIVGSVDKYRIHRKPVPSSLALRAGSSSDMQICGSGSLTQSRSIELNAFPYGNSLSSPLLGIDNAIGVVGGVSAVSTLEFLEKLVKWSSRDGETRVPYVVCDDPVLSKELSSYERSFSPYPSSRNTCPEFDDTLIVEKLQHKGYFLERCGACCVVTPCHVSHTWHDKISKGRMIPILHIGDCVADELKAANLKPVEAGSSLRIGIVATNAVLAAGFYQEKLKNQGFEVLLPDKATMEHTVIPSLEAFNRGDMEGARNLLRIALHVLLVRGVNTVVLASEDMRGLLPHDDPLLKKCTDPMDALVRSTIRWAKSIQNTNTVF